MRVLVATHGHCFDGLASAVLFTRLFRTLYGARHELVYRGCGYGAAQLRPEAKHLTGDQNAILDFRLTPSDRVCWFFDHHPTALQLPGAAAWFEAARAGGRVFVDADYPSCARLVADVSRESFGVPQAGLEELVAWADRVDSAGFVSAEEAIDESDPVRRLVSVVEHHADDAFLNRHVPQLLEQSLAEVAASPEVRRRHRPLRKRRARMVELLRQRCQMHGRVVFADLTDHRLDSSGKFVSYARYPESVYSVLVGRQGRGAKILVGYNPWSPAPRDLDLSSICARYGGGGHPYVGAIPCAGQDLESARQAARQIVHELME